jgi:cystathionine gamma-synthase
LAKLGQPATIDTEAEDCLLVPSKKVADCCRNFMQDQFEKQGKGHLSVREVQFCMVLPRSNSDDSSRASSSSPPPETVEDPISSQLSIHIVLFPESAFPIAKTFWQHTGDGISSRMAAACLDLLDRAECVNGISQKQPLSISRPRQNSAQSVKLEVSEATSPTAVRSYGRNRHYARANGSGVTSSVAPPPVSSSASDSKPSAPTSTDSDADMILSEHSTYVEERYGRNMATIEAPRAKRALRKRIAGVASDEVQGGEVDVMNRSGEAIAEEEDVYLYPTGMSAIFHAHQLTLKAKEEKSVCFGFPYLDTLKILQKWGPGCFFLGNGDEDDLIRLEALLQTQKITSLFCEFPSNPLLRSPNLVRLRQLADKYDFLIVIDETIGNFVNVKVLPYADIVVSSLTKIFTGEANGMAGSLVLNSKGRHYIQLKQIQQTEYEDNFFNQNAIFLERNSRDFVRRVRRIDQTALTLVDMLVKSQQGRFNNVLKKVYYPTLMSIENYNQCKRPNAGYGGLLSVTFHSLKASMAFYDALRCAKGPSLGTNFTLASPFVILAHYEELDWAASYGVESNLVRISVGLEDASYLLNMFTGALLAAQEAFTTTTTT